MPKSSVKLMVRGKVTESVIANDTAGAMCELPKEKYWLSPVRSRSPRSYVSPSRLMVA